MISLSIDGKKATVKEETTVLEAARSVGVKIPTLCYHPELKPNSACRLCTVEVAKGGRTWLTASCSLPAEEGMEVQTASEKVLAGRRMVMELLVARCSGVEQIKELAQALGAKTDRLEPRDEDCILCGLCVAVCSQKLGARAIGFSGRGVTRKVTKPFGEESISCVACGACGYVCPTGAVQMERETLEANKERRQRRFCRYMRMGMVPYAVCPSAFECFRCELDQRMEDTLGTHAAFVATPAKQTDPVEVNGYAVMPERYYTAEHVWTERIGGHLRLGVDDFAQKLVGPVDDVEVLVERGAELKAGQSIWRLKLSNGRSVTMSSPVSGTIVSVNEDIAIDPALLRKSPYHRGWICVIRPADADRELEELRFKDPSVPFYRRQETDPVDEWVGDEAARLRRMLQDQGAEISAEGPIGAELIPEAQWQSVTQAFFGTQQ